MRVLEHRGGGARPGASAHARFEQARAAWRRRVLARVRPPIFALVAILVGANYLYGGSLVSWLSGLAAGALVALYVALGDSPPEHIDRWRRGAEGERRTAKRLRRLEREGWHVLHDLPAPQSNRDHVVIGPGGVFLLDTKALDGNAEVTNEVLRVRRRDAPLTDGYECSRLTTSMRAAAAGLKEDIARDSGQRVWVNAVVVVWGRFDQRVVDGNRITFVHGDEVADWLRARSEVLQPARAAAIAAALRAASEVVPDRA